MLQSIAENPADIKILIDTSQYSLCLIYIYMPNIKYISYSYFILEI